LAASLVRVHHLRPLTLLVGPLIVSLKWLGGVSLSAAWYFIVLAIKNHWSGPITADLTTTVLHRYNLLINNVKPVHSLASRFSVIKT